jgi:hypothetical protein
VLDPNRQITPALDHGHAETMENVLFFLDRSGAFCPVYIETAALILPSG